MAVVAGIHIIQFNCTGLTVSDGNSVHIAKGGRYIIKSDIGGKNLNGILSSGRPKHRNIIDDQGANPRILQGTNLDIGVGACESSLVIGAAGRWIPTTLNRQVESIESAIGGT